MQLMSTTEAAKYLGLSPSQVRRYCIAGRLPAVKVGRVWLIDAGDLEKFAEKPRKRGRRKKGE